VADTRGNGFTGPYGPPALVANATRSFTITGQCGVPAGAAAVSFNFTALNIGGAGDLRVFPAGGGVPLVSTLNYNANTPNIANAAIVPLGTGGAITVQADAVAIDLIIDLNGYYANTPGTGSGFFMVSNSGLTAIWGQTDNTTTFARGVLGYATSATGTTYGVLGVTASTALNAAGVSGVDVSGGECCGVAFNRAGVRGGSALFYGVLGISQNISVYGQLETSTGVLTSYGMLGSTFGTAGDATPGPWGVFAGGNLGATGAKHFVEPHPSDASRVILYSSLEGREVGTYFRGTARTTRGQATIEVPEDFRMVTDEDGLTVQLTPVGPLTMISVETEDLNRIVVRSSKDVTFHYLVQGVRRAFKDFEPVSKGLEFAPRSAEDRIPAYLTEEARKRLIANGTYNPDGTVNLDTAERLGWVKAWKEREEKDRAAAEQLSTRFPRR
jgi:hypothetical protein